MQKSKVLLIGSGQCGNRYLSRLLDKDRRYTGIFSNANLKDMEGLKYFDVARNVFYIPNATGTGKSKDLAEKYMKEEVRKFGDMILKYAIQDTVEIICSADGGWGSGSLTPTVTAIRMTCPTKSINVIAIFPSLMEGEISFKNTISFWNDLINLREKNMIDSIQIIDNTKRKTLEEVDEYAIAELDYTLGFGADNIDENDSKKINTAKGYKLLLKLDDKYKNIDMAIDNALKNSVFALPSSYDCSYLGVSVKQDSFYAEDFKSKFDSLEAPYCGYNEKNNFLLLSGLPMPKDIISIIQMALKDTEQRKNNRISVKEDLLIPINDNLNKEVQGKEKKQQVKSTISSEDLDNLFDGEYWKD